MASSNNPPPLGLDALAGEPGISPILLDHALRGVRVQVLLRLLLGVFTVATVLLDPPAHGAVFCTVVALAYLVWCVVGLVLGPRGGLWTILYAWLAVFIDLLVLTVLAIVASESDNISWTSDVLVNGFAIVPMIAATQLRPRICAAVVVPTVIVYFVSSAVARAPNGEPWSLIALRTLVIATLALGAVLLSAVQRSRVATIGSLAAQRSRLLDEAAQIEERERRDLAEHLHDGALQYVLGARQELAVVRDGSDPDALDRVDEALHEAGRLLRSTLGELHPAVLEQAGLPVALTDLAWSVERRTNLTIAVDTVGWPEGLRTPVDPLLYATARELLTNVVKHAQARRVELTAEADDDAARVIVVDDGVGVDEAELDRKVAEGHIGLASRRVRLEQQGGSLRIAQRSGGGTVAVAEVPVT
ncbi:ATP-binding protein [Gordonia sp. CPCC 205515]|uniref:sensor histidine kinase n=1 Tax=Gordonia sp. CPCC 205515 TaxID=3140791 RepID=UPI003AF3CF48